MADDGTLPGRQFVLEFAIFLDQRCLPQRIANPRKQFLRFKRLGQQVVGALAQRLIDRSTVAWAVIMMTGIAASCALTRCKTSSPS